MEKFAEFIARHPVALGVALAVAAGYGTWNAYRVGRQVEALRVLTGDAARAASEALGG